MVGQENFDPQFVADAQAVRLNNSSTQVYMALKPGETVDESTGDLLFCSTAPLFRTEALLSRNITSRTFSFYYPRTRPTGKERFAIVSSTNANWSDWANLNDEEYEASKKELIETTLDALEKYVPNCRNKMSSSKQQRRERSIITRNMLLAQALDQVRRTCRQPKLTRSDTRPLPRRKRRYHHVWLAWSNQLRCDRRQRSRRQTLLRLS